MTSIIDFSLALSLSSYIFYTIDQVFILQGTAKATHIVMPFLMSSLFFKGECYSKTSWVQITRSVLEKRKDLKMVYDFVMFQFISSGGGKNFYWKKVAAEDWNVEASLEPVSVDFVMENKQLQKNFLVTIILGTKPEKKMLQVMIQPLEI